jgi:hypothetical protein
MSEGFITQIIYITIFVMIVGNIITQPKKDLPLPSNSEPAQPADNSALSNVDESINL